MRGRRYELGPAFEDWKDGSVSVSKDFKEAEKLFPVWMDKCCTDRAGQLLFEPSAEPQLFLVVVLTVACLHCLASMRRRREHAVIRSRSLEKLVADGFLALLLMWFLLSLIGCGPTASRGFLLFVYLILLPACIAGHIVSNIKLAFVYQWNKQKLKCDTTSDECDLSKIEVRRQAFSTGVAFGWLLLKLHAVWLSCSDLWNWTVGLRGNLSGF